MFMSANPSLLAASSAAGPSSVTQNGAKQADSHKSARVEKAIKDFESLFMSMMIKEMRQTSSGEGLFPGDSSDTYGGMFDMMLGKELAEGNGLGLDSLFRSSAAISQVENRLKANTSFVNHQQALEGYRNAELTGSSTAPPGT